MAFSAHLTSTSHTLIYIRTSTCSRLMVYLSSHSTFSRSIELNHQHIAESKPTIIALNDLLSSYLSCSASVFIINHLTLKPYLDHKNSD